MKTRFFVLTLLLTQTAQLCAMDQGAERPQDAEHRMMLLAAMCHDIPYQGDPSPREQANAEVRQRICQLAARYLQLSSDGQLNEKELKALLATLP